MSSWFTVQDRSVIWKAKAYRLAEGKVNDGNLPSEMTQEEAVADVRSDMLELNQHVMDALTKHDISAVSLSPHRWAKNTGKEFLGDLGVFDGAPTGIVVRTHGDVVECDPPMRTSESCPVTIWSTAWQPRSGVKTIGVCDGGVEGVLSEPPPTKTMKQNSSPC